MGQFELVAADIDGTLLAPDGQLSKRTIQVVAQLRAAGVAFVLATSRRFTGTAPVAAALDHAGSLILYDGAQVRRYPDGAVEEIDALDAAVARQAAEILHTHDLRAIAQYGDEAGERLRVGAPAALLRHDEAYLAQFPTQMTMVPIRDLISDDEPLLRLLAFGPFDHLQLAAADMQALNCAFQLLPEGNYGAAELTVFAPSASKGSALLRLAKRLDIPRERTFAIGDGLNDISMLRLAGMGVAMGNAAPTVQSVAKAIAGTSSDDGAALAIERYCLS